MPGSLFMLSSSSSSPTRGPIMVIMAPSKYLLCTLFILFLQVLTGHTQERPQQLAYDISEELEEGSFIANLRSDADMEGRHSSAELQKVKFRFLSPPKVTFRLEEDTGILKTGQKIDRDTECPRLDVCEYMLDVVALIPSTMTFLDVIKVRVDITDLNDNWPEFPESSISQDILESATLGTSIVVPTATDPDSTRYSLRDYVLEGEKSPFELELREKLDGSIEVRLILKSALDRESKDQYRMKVVAHDGGGKTGSIDVFVRVLDANDNDPVFDNQTYEVTIYENVPIQTTILTVHASDPDRGDYGKVVYGFSTQTLNSYHHLFGIDEEKGDLYIKGTVDFEEGSVFHLFITAHDQGPDARTSDTTVIVRVKDVNDHAPEIKVNTLSASGTDTAEIAEDATLGTFVAHVTVTDPDSGNKGKFNCTLNDSHFLLQQLYESEYKIITQSILDRESRNQYNLALTCTDRGDDPQVSIKHLTVKVTDINDNSPVFTQNSYAANVIENNLVGTFITQVNATDRDDGMNAAVSYSLEPSVRSLFEVDPSSGIITTRVVFDHEQTQQIRFKVVAVDSGEPPRSSSVLVVVTINDVNDEVPKFSQPTYSFGVYENEDANTEVGIVHAVDADSEPYNQFELAFLPHERSEDFFAINPNSGKITTRTKLDREKQGVYHLIVMAMDKGSPPMTSTVTASVYVADKNDNAPIFTYPTQFNNTVQISSQSPIGYRVTRVRAYDLDIGKNSNISYSFSGGNGEGYFMINTHTGSVMVNADLYGISYEMFNFEIIAKDGGIPVQTSVTNLNIVVNKSIGYPTKESPLMVGQNFTIVISLACVSGLVVVILILAIVCIRRQDTSRQQRKQKAQQKRLAQTPTSNDQLTMFSKVPNGGLENSACVKSQDDVKILISGPERKPSKRTNLRQQGIQKSDISMITPAHSSAIQQSASIASGGASGSGPTKQEGPWALAQKELEVHQLLHLLKKEGDADSTSSGEGSNTDSGRGPSEEGDRTDHSRDAHNHSRDTHNQSRDSHGGRRAERAAAAAARNRETSAGQPTRSVPSLVNPTGSRNLGPGQGQGYFRDGSQLTTFNPRSSQHFDPRSPRHPLSTSRSTPNALSTTDSVRSPPEGNLLTPPARLHQQQNPQQQHHHQQQHNPHQQQQQRTYEPSSGGQYNYNTDPFGRPHHTTNHQLASRGLGGSASIHDVSAGARAHSSSSSFRPNDVPLQHSASRDRIPHPRDPHSQELYSKDVVV